MAYFLLQGFSDGAADAFQIKQQEMECNLRD